ncbi:MAG TPA: hypothetical protein VMI54_21525 [Polyangiaceae bacterium]|nr:hypothetical protein [Polyangiaceae bacterium]
MRTFLLLATLALTPPLALGCGVRWSPNDEYVAQTHADPAAAYAKVLQIVNERGYHIVEQRDAERTLRIRAHINENFAAQNSFITASVAPNGDVRFTPSGYLVRGDKIHKRLAQELEDLKDETGGGASVAPPATVAPVASPEPPPAPMSTAVALPMLAPTPAPAPVETPAPAPKPSSKPATTAKASTPPKPSTKSDKPKSDDDWVPVK